MANNPYNNKVQLSDGTVLMDLTGDTVTPTDLALGVTAHDRSGAAITGTQKGFIYYGTCSTAAGTQAKTVSVNGITELYEGLCLRILFINAQSYDGVPTLTINSLTTKSIYRGSGSGAAANEWMAGEVIDLVYDGYNFIIVDGETRDSIPQPSDATPQNITWAGDPGVSDDYARADHSHPKPHLATNTYNDAVAAEVGSYLDHVRAVMALETDSSAYECIPCWLDQESYNGWPEEVNGNAIVLKLGVNRYFVLAQLLNGLTYTNVYDTNHWIGWYKVIVEDHLPVRKTYSEASGSFLTWVEQTLFPWLKSLDESLVVFSSDNYTGWPEQEQGIAKAYRRNYLLCLDAILASGNVYTNVYDSRTGHGWTGWKQTAFVNDSGTWYCKMPDGTLIQWGCITSLSFSSEIMITGTKTLPVSFIDTNFMVIASAVATGNNSYLFRVGANATSASSFDWSLGSGTSVAISGTNRAFNWIAIGRWKAAS